MLHVIMCPFNVLLDALTNVRLIQLAGWNKLTQPLTQQPLALALHFIQPTASSSASVCFVFSQLIVSVFYSYSILSLILCPSQCHLSDCIHVSRNVKMS